jgi:hypothetical protein
MDSIWRSDKRNEKGIQIFGVQTSWKAASLKAINHKVAWLYIFLAVSKLHQKCSIVSPPILF